MGNKLVNAVLGEPKVEYVDKYNDITAKKVREAKEQKARELREQAERERRELQEAERQDKEKRRQKQQQEEQEKQREEERRRKLQQESLDERKKLLDYNFGDKHGLRNFASIDIRDMQESDRGIRIGLFGPTGSGKSCLINTCERTMKVTDKGSCETQTSGAEGTIMVQEYLDDIGSKFCLIDTRGFFNYNVDEYLAMTNIVYGRIKPGEMIDLKGAEEVDEDDSWDTFSHWLHAIVIVLSAKDPLLLNGTHTTNLNTIREFMRPRGIAPVTVVTHVDQVKDESQLDQIKTKASAATGSSPSHVFFIQNYHPEHNERDFNIELRAMEILNFALVVGERYVKIHKQQQQYEAEEKQAAAVQFIAKEPIEDFFRRLSDTRRIPYGKIEPVIARLKEEDVTTAKLLRDNWDDLEAELPISSRMKTYIKEALF
ncbi:Hypp3687 [Branchiostoma lanceolatum]|uniref:Hypp3687 protein n=1 Tax=Branchiostoma lanceolatum TaxID=7740 RepID=A0A8K0A1Z5_BRALA|nr:Hypp3687 [Branchiostoma lanceolatum]